MRKFRQKSCTYRTSTRQVITPVWFILRREPYHHKLQYAKVPKYDGAAAILGVVIGSFIVYLALNSVGSGGVDLTDLTVLVWYLFIWVCNLVLLVSLYRNGGVSGLTLTPRLWFFFFFEVNV